jgi:RNA polymerase sigma factor (sigma-70 family)
MSDLAERFAGGDADAFTQVVESYSQKVYALCYRILRDPEEAKDMAQEVFVRVYSKRKSFQGRSSLYTWIYRIAFNMCLSHLKRRRPPLVPLDRVESRLVAEETGNGAGYAQLERQLAAALESLPPRQRAVFAMRFHDKMSFKEIAEATGTSMGAAKANHHFAVQHLRRILGQVGEE